MGDVRTVVHTKSKDPSKQEKGRRHSKEKHSTADRNLPLSNEQLLITVTEEGGTTAPRGGEQKRLRSAYDERKVSLLGEDQFEPDYDEGETAVETEHRPRKESTAGGDRKHSHHKHKHHSSSHGDPSSKSKKHHHKKNKKSKKHKTKSKRSEK